MQPDDLPDMLTAINEIQMARTPFELERFVVGCHHTPEQRYAHCVLNLSIAYDNLRIAKLKLEEMDLAIAKLKKKRSPEAKIAWQIKAIEREQLVRASLGAAREFEHLYHMWKTFPKRYTRSELNAAQPEEFTRRLRTQAEHDIHAMGRISVSNLEGLRQIDIRPYPALDHLRSVEQRFLERGDVKVLIGVPTIERARALPYLDSLEIPNYIQRKYYNCFGRRVDAAYNDIVQTALEDHADFILTSEDDTKPPADAFVRLLALVRSRPRCAAGAWYPLRSEAQAGKGVHIVLRDGKREFLQADGAVHEVYTLAMGLTLYPIEIFMDVPYPWFHTTENLSQDSFFSQQAREAGWTLLVDTSIRCQHIDRDTGKVYE